MDGARLYTQLDLRAAYNLIRIYESDEWKTAFRIWYGLYEFMVMPFGLTNAFTPCQRFVNDTLREYLDIFFVCYLDDILIYTTSDPDSTPEETLRKHRKQVRLVLRKLQEAGLFVKPEKCEFEIRKTTFLGFMVSTEGIEMDPEKVSAVKDWETPAWIRDVQCFMGFAHFYRRFMEGFS